MSQKRRRKAQMRILLHAVLQLKSFRICQEFACFSRPFWNMRGLDPKAAIIFANCRKFKLDKIEMNESPQGKMSEGVFTLELMTESFHSVYGTSLISEYAGFLQNFLDGENVDQQILKEIQALTLEHDLGSSSGEDIAANVENYEKQLQLIKDKLDNLTFQSIAKKEIYKLDAAENESLIEKFYATECEKATKDLQKSSEKWDKIELDLRDDNVLAIAKKNIQLNEMKNSLQKQIFEKNTAISRANEDTKVLRVLFDKIRAQYKQLRFGKKNEMRFDEVFSVQITSNGNPLKEAEVSLDKVEPYETPRHEILTNPQYSGKLRHTQDYKQPVLKPNPYSFLLTQGIMHDKVIASHSGQNSLSKVTKTDEPTIIEIATTQQNLSENESGRPRKLPKIYKAKNLKLK